MKHSLLITFSFYCFLILFITCISTIFLYEKIYTHQYEQAILDASSRTIYSIDNALNSVIEEVSTFSTSISTNQPLQKLIASNNISYNARNELDLKDVLYNLNLANKHTSALNIFDLHGRHYTYSYVSNNNPFYDKPFMSQHWYHDVEKNQGGATLLLWTLQANNTSHYTGLSIARQILDIHTLDLLGVVSVDIDTKILEEILSPFTQKYNSTLLIMDKNNQPFMKIDSPALPELASLQISDLPLNGEIKRIEDISYVINTLTNRQTGLKFITISPTVLFDNNLLSLKIITLFILLGGFITIILGVFFSTQKLLEPIHALTNNMLQVIDKHEFIPVSIKTSNNEIGTLKNIYNQMIHQIQIFIAQSIDEEKLKRKSELAALQAQIKPHFLYNTFDAISALALQGDTLSTYHALKQLSSFYRLSLSNGDEYIPLEQDIQLVKDYTQIMKIRYPDSFELICNIAPQTTTYLVPKLTLQPFIENAIHHGILPCGETGFIKLSSYLHNHLFYIEIEDNGIGMSQDTIHYLLDIHKPGVSFGAKSTIERIHLLYGEQALIKIQSTINKGTNITLILPIKEPPL